MKFYCNGKPIGRVDDVELEGFDIAHAKVWKDETFTEEVDTSGWSKEHWQAIFGLIPIIRCKDCIYYDPPHIENDGQRYEYKDMPPEAFSPITKNYVSIAYGINMGGRCCRDYECGYSEERTFRRVFTSMLGYSPSEYRIRRRKRD